MKFKVISKFRHGYTTFEAGNSHDSEQLGMSDELVDVFHRAGWVSIDGREDNAVNPGHVEVIPDNVMHGHSARTN